MFTGIVEAGAVESLDGSRLTVRAPLLRDCEIGASVSINGVCLTVTSCDGGVCTFDLADETIDRSTLGAVRRGERVNVERPLRAGAELGGHIVQGHVDAVGEILAAEREGDGTRMRVSLPAGLDRYVVEKGSITVDGVALTVTAVDADAFEVALIPQTLAVTTFGDADAGRRVNLEVDVLAKYIEKLVLPRVGDAAREAS